MLLRGKLASRKTILVCVSSMLGLQGKRKRGADSPLALGVTHWDGPYVSIEDAARQAEQVSPVFLFLLLVWVVSVLFAGRIL